MKVNQRLYFFLVSTLLASQTVLAQKDTKGLLPEIKMNSSDEAKNQEKNYTSEVMITRAEIQAISSLEKILVKKRGTAEEPDLLYRLAELHMRRAKSGRFFDLQEQKQSKVTSQAKQSLAKAVRIYDDIIVRFPKFKESDSVYFNNALASLQIGQIEKSKNLYSQIIAKFPKSPLIPDALLDLGELLYNQQKFAEALAYFDKLEAHKQSKAYIYGVYKSAWCHYNLKQTEEGIQKLKYIVASNPADTQDGKKYNLRQEALRDLTLFVGETVNPRELYAFFSKITTPEELGEVINNLALLYDSHSRHKEISIFVKEFINKNPRNSYVGKSYVKLIETSETLKDRKQVLAYMKDLSAYCVSVAKNDPKCSDEFKKVSLEVSKKWWEIWLKNKKHSEFSQLTESAFEILLSNEDPTKPDSISRYAYAELLFQQDKFESASQNYEKVSLDKALDEKRRHDSLYSAIYSLDKLGEKKKNSTYSPKQEQLAERYIQEFPNKEHVENLKFKLGFLAYQNKNTQKSLAYLSPIATSSKDKDLKTKAEDIILDIHNLNKDYKSLITFAKDAAVKTTSADRKKNLLKIAEEAQYSQMVVDAKNLKAEERIDKLLQFSNEYKTSDLSKDALWQSISLAYSNGLDIKGADLSLTYISKYPNDSKNLDALKEAVKAYTEAGHLKKAIAGIEQLATLDKSKSSEYKETVCDLQQIAGQQKESYQCYFSLINGTSNQKRKEQLVTKIVSGLDRSVSFSQGLKKVDGLEKLILQYNMEPYATEILVDRAQALYDAKKFTDAFNMSLRLNSRPVDANLRSRARLIQAAILEDEFIKQSVKASEAKFALVLSIKAEKLDKAYTAYNSVISMSKDPAIHAKALAGIDRIYEHFIDAVSNMPIPASLSGEEQQALRAELVNLASPFKTKKQENFERLQQVSGLTVADVKFNWQSFPVSKPYEPQIRFPEAKNLSYFLPNSLNINEVKVSRLPASAKSCDSKKVTAASIGGCIQSKQYGAAEKLALQLTEAKETRPIGLYYLSVIADQTGFPLKSLWLVQKALDKAEGNPYLAYQKAKIVYQTEGLGSAMPYLEKSELLKKYSNEVALLSGLKSYSQRDYISTTEDFSLVPAKFIASLNLAPLHIESFAQKGDYKGSISLAQSYLKSDSNNPEINLQLARIYEYYANAEANSKQLAIENYQAALKKAKDSHQKDWIKQKIAHLSEAKS